MDEKLIKLVALSTDDEILTVYGKVAKLLDDASHWQYKNNYLKTHENFSALREKKMLETKLVGDVSRLIVELECLVASLEHVVNVTKASSNVGEMRMLAEMCLKDRAERVLARGKGGTV